MTQQPLAASKTKPFGPNVSQFLAQALPAGKGGHVWVIADEHNTIDHTQVVTKALPFLMLPDAHNVGTLGLEGDILRNVAYWAYKDGRMPVSKDKQGIYLETLLTAAVMPKHQEVQKLMARLAAQVIDNKGHVLAYDMRYPWRQLFQTNDNTLEFETALRSLPKDEDERIKLRTVPGQLDRWARRVASDHARRNPGDSMDPIAIKAMWVLLEMRELINKNSGYGSRLDALEKFAASSRALGMGYDAQSAAVLVGNMDSSHNIVVIHGHNHFNGTAIKEFKSEGVLVAHLERLGQKVTPSLLTTTRALPFWIKDSAPSGNWYELIYKKFCAAKAPMHLLVVDKDVVLDVSSHTVLQSVQSQPNVAAQAKSVAQQLLKSNAHLTCDNPALPTTAACARDEAKGKAGPGPCLPGGR